MVCCQVEHILIREVAEPLVKVQVLTVEDLEAYHVLLWIIKHSSAVAAQVLEEIDVLGLIQVEVILLENTMFDQSVFAQIVANGTCILDCTKRIAILTNLQNIVDFLGKRVKIIE